MTTKTEKPIYSRIHTVVRAIPAGRVATYGQIAAIVGNCTPRMVGYAMAVLQANSNVPWHRVINAQGKISPRADGGGAFHQQVRLEEEGICFNEQGRVKLAAVQWSGPTTEWLIENDFDPEPTWRAP